MKAKRIVIVAVSLALLMALPACGGKPVQKIDTLAEGKIDLYESAAELEEAATVVVRAERTAQEENIAKPLGAPNTYHGYTISAVRVKEVLKNTSGRDIQAEDELPIIENQFTYPDGSGTQVTCHINRYQLMRPGNEYYLYLRYSENDGWYVILSGLFGKVPVAEDEPVLFPDDDLTMLSAYTAASSGSETQQILQNIRSESLERYGAGE